MSVTGQIKYKTGLDSFLTIPGILHVPYPYPCVAREDLKHVLTTQYRLSAWITCRTEGVKDSGAGREGLRYAIEEMTEKHFLLLTHRLQRRE